MGAYKCDVVVVIKAYIYGCLFLWVPIIPLGTKMIAAKKQHSLRLINMAIVNDANGETIYHGNNVDTPPSTQITLLMVKHANNSIVLTYQK